MTDQELFDKLKRDGECWEPYYAVRVGNERIPNEKNPNFDTWEGFGWLWERAIEKEWWVDFIDRHANLMEHLHTVSVNLIQPTRFKEALKEYLG